MTKILTLPAAGLLVALGACSATQPLPDNQAAFSASTPGWTGNTIVMGSNSTIADDAQATYLQQKWGVGRQR